MNLTFFVESRYIKDRDGRIYNPEGVMKFPLWNRYLEIFDTLTIVARVKYDPDYIGKEENLASSESVSFFELPYFIGPKQFFFKRKEVIRRIKDSLNIQGAYLMRVPGTVGTIASKYLSSKGILYGAEIVGDPIDVFSKGAVAHPLRLYFKYRYYYDLRRIARDASAILYVTRYALQSRYKNSKDVFTTYASNVSLLDEHIIKKPRTYKKKQNYNIISIGSLEQMYKGPDVVLESLRILKEAGYQVSLSWIGAGKYMKKLVSLARELNVDDRVQFLGYVSKKQEITNYLDESDFFVLPSKTEGLPRAIIEAMARGLPVVATNVGGIPELVQNDLLIDRNNSKQLAEKLILLIENSDFSSMVSSRNLAHSIQYSEKVLADRRRRFYMEIKNFKN